MRNERIKWLLDNPSKWEGWIAFTDPRRSALIDEMRELGLYSRKTARIDIKIEGAINEARRHRRQKHAKQVRAAMGRQKNAHGGAGGGSRHVRARRADQGDVK